MLTTLTRYSLNGLLFAAMGPAVFWLLYPLGPLTAWLLAEAGCHLLRFISFRLVVFPGDRGFLVSPRRYLIAMCPLTLIGLLTVALLRDHLDRTQLTLFGAAISLSLGYLINRLIYSRPGKHGLPSQPQAE